VLTQRTARDVLLFETGPKLGENTRLGVESELAAPKPGLLFVNLQSTLGMHVSLRETRGGSRIQTWNRYAYVANNPLSYIDPLGLSHCAGGLRAIAQGDCDPVADHYNTDLFGGIGSLSVLTAAFTPTAVGFSIPTNSDGMPLGYVNLFPLYGNWDMVSLLGQVVWSPWYSVRGTLEGRGHPGETKLNPTTSYGLNPSNDVFVALPDNNLMGQCVDVQAPGGSASGVPVGDVGPWNGGGTRSNLGKFNNPYWSPGTPGSVGFQPPQTSTGTDLRGRTLPYWEIGAGIDISYALQQQLGLKGNTTVSWRFAPCSH